MASSSADAVQHLPVLERRDQSIGGNGTARSYRWQADAWEGAVPAAQEAWDGGLLPGELRLPGANTWAVGPGMPPDKGRMRERRAHHCDLAA